MSKFILSQTTILQKLTWFLVIFSKFQRMTSTLYLIIQHCLFLELVCPEGTFGRGCLEECGRCVNNTCHHVNGSCSGPCQDGWVGEECLLAKGKTLNNAFWIELCYLSTVKKWREAGIRGQYIQLFIFYHNKIIKDLLGNISFKNTTGKGSI